MDIANLKQNGKAEALARISLKMRRIICCTYLLMLVCLIYILIQRAMRIDNKIIMSAGKGC